MMQGMKSNRTALGGRGFLETSDHLTTTICHRSEGSTFAVDKEDGNRKRCVDRDICLRIKCVDINRTQ